VIGSYRPPPQMTLDGEGYTNLVGSGSAGLGRLKVVKRQMYGRPGLDLLQARFLGAPR
jgi:hypothetical protein